MQSQFKAGSHHVQVHNNSKIHHKPYTERRPAAAYLGLLRHFAPPNREEVGFCPKYIIFHPELCSAALGHNVYTS